MGAHFAKYIAAGIGHDDVEDMYKNAHKAIRENPEFKPKAKKDIKITARATRSSMARTPTFATSRKPSPSVSPPSLPRSRTTPSVFWPPWKPRRRKKSKCFDNASYFWPLLCYFFTQNLFSV